MADEQKVVKIIETRTTTERQTSPQTQGDAPIVRTMSGMWTGATTVELQGEITPNRSSTQYSFEYGPTPNLIHSTAAMPIGDGGETVPVSIKIEHLDPTSPYFFRLIGENTFGKSAGAMHTLPAAQTTPTTDEKKTGTLANILSIAALVVIVVVVIWGLIHVATLLSPWLSSLFSRKTTTPAALHVQAPGSVTSGTPFTMNWTYSTSQKGTYAFLYPCNDSLHFETAGAQGTPNTIPCGAAFTVSGNSLTLTPTLSGTKTLSEPLTVLFVPSQGSQVQGSATVQVNPAAQSPTPTPVINKPVVHAGPADLSVAILSATVDQNGFGTVVFDIDNRGSGDSGSYSFVVYLPMRSQTYTYYSPAQISLSPGSHIVSTLRFTQGMPGAVSIIVDPSNVVNDSNHSNNYAAQNMSAPYGYNPQPYYGQPYVY